jgi:8-oxo-dGTP diphosphatase
MRNTAELSIYPEVSAVYFLIQDMTVVYVGQTKDLRNSFQVARHADKMFNRMMYVAVPASVLDDCETACIVYFKPKYNRQRGTKHVTPEAAEAKVRGILSEDDLALLGIERRTPCKYEYDYPRPSVTVDCVVFGFDPNDAKDPLKVLMIQRKAPPYENCWALPGGFVEVDDTFGGESLERAAQRELEEETGLKIDIPDPNPPPPRTRSADGEYEEAYGGWARVASEEKRPPSHLEQLYTFGAPRRDPRGRVISVAYFVLVRATDYTPQGSSDAVRALWVGMGAAMSLPLAFDHGAILTKALTRLQGKIRYEPIGFNLLPAEFTLGDLRALYEGILQRQLDPSNFRKRVLASNVLKETGEATQGTGRPAKLYSFDKKAYDRAVKDGFNFEI